MIQLKSHTVRINLPFTICISLLLLTLVSCGPENNSRYGDAFWDPQDTWEKAEVVSKPTLDVVYRDTDADPDVEDWEAYVSLDFVEINRQAANGAVVGYSLGSSDVLSLGAFDLSGSLGLSTLYYYDTNTTTDNRIRFQDPGEYNISLSFEVTQPNGTLRLYDMNWDAVVVPGEISRDTYYTNYINSTLVAYCAICHAGNNTDATTAFDIDSVTDATRRDRFIDKIDNPTAGRELPSWVTDSDHPGNSALNSASSSEVEFFNTFANTMTSRDTAGDNIAVDFPDLITVAEPSTMTADPFE